MDPTRQKARFNENGSYVTRKQLKFIKSCARYPSNTKRKLRFNYRDILDYYLDWTMMYNIVYDLNELDPKAAYFFWDGKSECLCYKVDSVYLRDQIKQGNNLLEKIGITDFLIDEDDVIDEDDEEDNHYKTENDND